MAFGSTAYNPIGGIPYLGKLLTTVTNNHIQNKIPPCGPGANFITCSTAIVTGGANQWTTAAHKVFSDYYFESVRYGPYTAKPTMSIAELSEAIARTIESGTYGGVSLARARQVVSSIAAKAKAGAPVGGGGVTVPISTIGTSSVSSAYAVAPVTKLQKLMAALPTLQQQTLTQPGLIQSNTGFLTPPNGGGSGLTQEDPGTLDLEPTSEEPNYLLYAGIGAVVILGVALYMRQQG